MVSSISSNQGVYAPSAAQAPQGLNDQAGRTNLLQSNEMDTFVSHLEQEHKKAVVKKNIIGGSVTAASLLALLGGTLMKGKIGRALSIAPLALTTLFFGAATLLKGNKTPDFRQAIENAAMAAQK